jgi:hypothetical protein
MRTMTTDDWKHVFDVRGNDSGRWLGYAYDLLESSAALLDLWSEWRRGFEERAAGKPQHSERLVGFQSAATMLRGMACECLLKARGLEQGTFRLAEGGKFVPIKALGKKQHDLVRLADLVGFVLESDEEVRALRGLSRAIVAGRYPILGTWEAERQHVVDGPPLLVSAGMEVDRAGDDILRRLFGGFPLPGARAISSLGSGSLTP